MTQTFRSFLIYFIPFLLFIPTLSYPSDFKGGGMIGITCNIGSIVKRTGVFASGYFLVNQVQVNTNIRWYYNFRSYGPPLKGTETRFSLGALYSWGGQHSYSHRFFSEIDSQTGQKYAIGYNYNRYFDKTDTSQPTGTIFCHLNKVQIAHENDLFGWNGGSDRYRTASFLVNYLYKENIRLGSNVILWTGNFKRAPKITDENYPARYGYKSHEKSQLGYYSHGIWSVQVEGELEYLHTIRGNVGIDWEWIRNIFQNRFIHDMYFLPDFLMPNKNMHIPMLDTDGKSYLFGPGQKVERAGFYYQGAMNPNLFY